MRVLAELHASEASCRVSALPAVNSRAIRRRWMNTVSESGHVGRTQFHRRFPSPSSFRDVSMQARFPDAPDLAIEQSMKSSPPQLLVFDQVPSMGDLQEILPILTPKQLADAIWSFAKQGLKPANDLLDVIALEVKSKLKHFKSQDLSNTVWALAVLKYNPGEDWWQLFERQVYMNMTDFNGRELANLMWALAVLEYKPVFILDSVLSHTGDNFEEYSAGTLHLMIWSVGKLGYCPSDDWMDKFLRASQASFFQFTPNEMSNIIWALAKLGHKLPSMWLDNFLMVAQWRFPSFNAKLLSIIVWSVAMLEHRPSQEWMLSFEEQIRDKFEEFSGQELAAIAWAFRKFGYKHEQNAVFYMLGQQDRFLEVDFDILSNPKLLGQVLNWQACDANSRNGNGPSSASTT